MATADVNSVFFNHIVQWGPGFGESAAFVRYAHAVHFADQRAQRWPTRIVDNRGQPGRITWSHPGPRREKASAGTIWDGEMRDNDTAHGGSWR